MNLISRVVARGLGLKRYFNGRPCKEGHIVERYVSCGRCLICSHAGATVWQEANAERVKAHKRAHYERNRELTIQRAAEWRKAHPERKYTLSDFARSNKRKADAEYRRQNPEEMRVRVRNRRARLKAATGAHSVTDIRAIFSAQRGRCAWCATKLMKRHVDHIHPIAKGGSNDRANLQILCPTCNHRKHAKDPIDFAQQEGRLL